MRPTHHSRTPVQPSNPVSECPYLIYPALAPFGGEGGSPPAFSPAGARRGPHALLVVGVRGFTRAPSTTRQGPWHRTPPHPTSSVSHPLPQRGEGTHHLDSRRPLARRSDTETLPCGPQAQSLMKMRFLYSQKQRSQSIPHTTMLVAISPVSWPAHPNRPIVNGLAIL